jgi:hypothetical protein
MMYVIVSALTNRLGTESTFGVIYINYPVKAQWFLYVPPALTYYNSAFFICVFRMVLTINSVCFPKQH